MEEAGRKLESTYDFDKKLGRLKDNIGLYNLPSTLSEIAINPSSLFFTRE